MQGKSLKPLLENTIKPDNFRKAIYYHYYDFPAFHMVKKMYGIRTKQYKLIHAYDDVDEWELYDLKKDLKQNIDISKQPEYAELVKKYSDKLKVMRNFVNQDPLTNK